jgi:hypothetical protein
LLFLLMLLNLIYSYLKNIILRNSSIILFCNI